MPDLLYRFCKICLLLVISLTGASLEACGSPTSLAGDAVAPDRADLQLEQDADGVQEPDLDPVEIPNEVPEHSDPPGEEPYEDFAEWEIMPYDGPTWAALISAMYENNTKAFCESPDGGFLAAGWVTYPFNNEDQLWVVKVDAEGRLAWQRQIAVDADSEGRGMHCLADGTSLAIGTSLGNLVVAKLDDSGRMLWSRGYDIGPPLHLYSASQCRDGKIVLTGSTGISAVIISMTESGDPVWARSFNCSGLVSGGSAAVTADGGCVAVGQKDLGGDPVSMVLIRLSPDGTLVWQRVLGGPLFSMGTAMARLPGEVFAATASVYGERFEAWDVLVLLFDENGEILNAGTYGGRDTDAGVSVRATAAGNLLVSGYTESFGVGGAESLLMMLDPAGRVLWARTFGREGWDQAWDGMETSDGGIVVAAGTMVTFEEHLDALLLKLDPNGRLAGECPPGFGQEQTLRERFISLTEAEPCLVSEPLSVTEIHVGTHEGDGVAMLEPLCEP